VHCRVAGGKRIMPSVDDLWATRASPISVSMRIVAVAPPNAARTEICAKAETAEVRVGATTQIIAQRTAQNNYQSHSEVSLWEFFGIDFCAIFGIGSRPSHRRKRSNSEPCFDLRCDEFSRSTGWSR
jgi:hypothetical protein